MLSDIMRRRFTLALFFMLCPWVAAPAVAQEAERPLSVAREMERLATARTFWPGPEPLTVSGTTMTIQLAPRR